MKIPTDLLCRSLLFILSLGIFLNGKIQIISNSFSLKGIVGGVGPPGFPGLRVSTLLLLTLIWLH